MGAIIQWLYEQPMMAQIQYITRTEIARTKFQRKRVGSEVNYKKLGLGGFPAQPE